jgi:hypothetical protein
MSVTIFQHQLRRRLEHALSPEVAACVGLQVSDLQQAVAGKRPFTASEQLRLGRRLGLSAPPDVIRAAIAERRSWPSRGAA